MRGRNPPAQLALRWWELLEPAGIVGATPAEEMTRCGLREDVVKRDEHDHQHDQHCEMRIDHGYPSFRSKSAGGCDVSAAACFTWVNGYHLLLSPGKQQWARLSMDILPSSRANGTLGSKKCYPLAGGLSWETPAPRSLSPMIAYTTPSHQS